MSAAVSELLAESDISERSADVSQCCSPRYFGLGLEAPRGLKKLSWS
jgi:hypothetical protein